LFLGCAVFFVRRERKICLKQENVMVKPSDWPWDPERGTEPGTIFKSFQNHHRFPVARISFERGFNMTTVMTIS